MLPYAKGPVVARARKGAPSNAEMQLLAEAYKTDGVVIQHARGHTQPPLLALAFEMVEARKWFSAPGAPQIKANTRYWLFSITEVGRKAYRDRMAEFGLER